MARFIAAVVVVVTLGGCGDDETFTIEGTIEGNPTMNMRFVYYANNTLNRGLTAAREGKFEFKGVAPVPAIVEILDNEYRLLGRLYAVNGDRIECRLTRGRPHDIKVNGSETSERWANVLAENAEALAGPGRNEVVERYVAANPSDVVSMLLMLTEYDASRDALRADSVLSSIAQEARPSTLVDGFNAMLQRLVAHTATEKVAVIPYFNVRDSLVSFRPSARPWSLVVLSDSKTGRSDSIVPALRKLSRKALRPKLQVAEFSMDRDTLSWRRDIRNDSAAWSQGWVPGSIASAGIERLGIPSLPYFIVVDSTGRQALRTSSVTEAEEFVGRCLEEKK